MVILNRLGSIAPWSNVASVLESGFKAGAPGEIRTRGLRFRKPLTYRRARQKTAEHRRAIADLVAFRSSFDPFTGAGCTKGKGLKQMTVRWPPSDWDEADLRRDRETRLPTQLYPFYLDKDDADQTLWRVCLDPRDGKAKPKRIGGPAPIFTAFRIMLTAYEAWLPNRPEERVYFIGSELRVGGMVKIGYSLNPAARLCQLQTSSPERLKIFATTPGGRDLEEKYHRRWKPRRRAGEWFVLGDCILDEIARLNAKDAA